MKKHFIIAGIALLSLSGCVQNHKDYDAAAKCQGLGNATGTAEYQACLNDERASQLMQQQHQDFDQMKQQQEDWKARRY